MKLKNIIYTVALALSIVYVSSCSNIDEDERLIYVKPAQVNRAVLIEDFTGQKCINCPYAALEIEKIVEHYGEENVIAVGIHCGLGMKDTPTANYQGLMTDVGNEYYAFWGKPGQPAGVVNRSTAQTTDYSTWSNQVRTEIEKIAPLSLKVNNSYNKENRTLDVEVNAMGTDGNTDGKLQVWLVEDNIISLQDMPKDLYSGGRKYDYVHNHVFRANLTSELWGDAVTIKEGETTSKVYSYVLPEKWNADNVSVVAFVTGTDNRNVKQVVKKSIINN